MAPEVGRRQFEEGISRNAAYFRFQPFSMEEIKAHYAPNWILIGDAQSDEHHHVLAGKVLFVSPDREAVYDTALELRPTRFQNASSLTISPSPRFPRC